ncbi:MAG: radical SAM protein [Lentisphaerae bacterium]|nr:radical SAM protein [Lentisphaerota bacterium]
MEFNASAIAAEAERQAIRAAVADPTAAARAVSATHPGLPELALLLSPAADQLLETMALKARRITRRHFGRNISLYAPLYLSNHCSSGCAYCGFASDRRQPRRHMSPAEMTSEMDALQGMGFEEVLLLTGERTPEVGFDYLRQAVLPAAERFHQVTLETFPMCTQEYAELARLGAVGVTAYQETYDAATYTAVHRWGPKKDYQRRLDVPAQALAAGMRSVGLGVLLGLADPLLDALCLYQHAQHLQRQYWRAGISISFPRLRPEAGGFQPRHQVDDRFLARMIYAFRICLPEVSLVLSTREAPAFRDGMAGVGINKRQP